MKTNERQLDFLQIYIKQTTTQRMQKEEIHLAVIKYLLNIKGENHLGQMGPVVDPAPRLFLQDSKQFLRPPFFNTAVFAPAHLSRRRIFVTFLFTNRHRIERYMPAKIRSTTEEQTKSFFIFRVTKIPIMDRSSLHICKPVRIETKS
jgi:hypothetical protein